MRWCAGLLVGLAACTIADAPDGGTAPPPLVTLGNAGPGELHVPALDGTDVRVVQGPQGGWHIWGSLHVENMDPEQIRTTFTLQSGGELLGETRRYNLPLQAVGSAYESVGLTMLLGDGQNPTAWDGGIPVHVTTTVEDRNGQRVVIERDWTATCCDAQR